ncbi:MAG: hypothetical protein GY839_05920 [candidate division Zixibacteria bacterium]|nr:hypothetical protein [candidate division Zixibacteria bacterium]
MNKIVAAILVIALCLLACVDKKPSDPIDNRPPETNLFLVIGDSLGVIDTTGRPDTSASMLVLHWYGDDPDGEVIGYEWAWDDTSSDTAWTFTELVSDTFYVKIREAARDFTFYIRAIDSDSLADPTPALMTFPIINSPPTVQLPVALMNDYSLEYNITLGYHTFTWTGDDPDGDESISGYQIFLGDSSMHVDTTLDPDNLPVEVEWIYLDSLTFSYTFSNIEPGFYRMFLRSYDIAGSYSDVVYYPDDAGVWEVIEPLGNILYVDDNAYFTSGDSMYDSVFISLALDYTSLDFTDRPFYYTQDLELSLDHFDILVWNAGSQRHFTETSSAIGNFITDGGRLFVSATFVSSDTTIYPFMPIDTIYDEAVTRPIRFVNPDPDALAGYPDTLETSQLLSHTFGFAPAAPEAFGIGQYKVLYTINATLNDPESVGDTVAVRYPYDPEAAEQPPAQVIFFSLPVFDCNVNDGFLGMMSNILLNEFADE